ISAFNSLTLSPALAALLLRPHARSTKSEARNPKSEQKLPVSDFGFRASDLPPEALPRIAFPLLGGWLGYVVAMRLVPASAGPLATLSPWLIVGFGLLAGYL